MKTDNKKTTKGNSALAAAALGRSAVGHVAAHSGSGLANTGTNISYEGATAPGAGGSVGTGYASGKEAAGEVIRTNNNAQVKAQATTKGEDDDLDQQEDIDADFDLDEEDEDVDYEEEDDDVEEELK